MGGWVRGRRCTGRGEKEGRARESEGERGERSGGVLAAGATATGVTLGEEKCEACR